MIKLVNRLGETKTLPVTLSFTRVPLGIQIPNQSLYGRSGAVKTGKSALQPRQFNLQGVIYHQDKQMIRQELDELLPFLMADPIKVYSQHDQERHLLAHTVGATQDWIDAGAELQLNITMIAFDPFWYGSEVLVAVSGTQAVEVACSAPVHPLVRTVSSVAGLTLQNVALGQELIVNGSGQIEVDNAEFTCKIDGNNRLDAVNREWLLTGFSLAPGTNEITVSAPVELIYRPRWY